MGRSKYLEAPVGRLFGKWCVSGYSHYDNEHYWFVSCTGCGNLFTRRASQLSLGRSSGCQSCNSFDREKYSFWEGIDGVSIQYLTKLKFRNKEIDVTLQDLADQWRRQNGKCRYTDIQLSLVGKDSEWAKSTASIDRIDSSKGYVKGNIQWVHKRINTMKNNMSEKEFIDFCYSVVNKNRRQNRIFDNDKMTTNFGTPEGTEEVVVYDYEWDTYMYPNCVTPWKCNGPHIDDSTD